MPAQAKQAPGVKGATVVSFDELAPRSLVAKFMKRYPTAGRDEICRRIEDALQSTYAKYLPAFIRATTINAWNSVRDGEKAAKRAKDAEAEAEREAQDAEGDREQARQAVKVVLMNLVSPTGKLWRDLTIGQYMAIGRKQFKHGQRMLSAGHKRTETLLTATSETELQKVFA